MKHTPVLLEEVVEAMNIAPGKRYIDATAGQLGHLNKISELEGEVLGIEYNQFQYEALQQKKDKNRIFLKKGNFADIEQIAHDSGFTDVDGVLFDLGISYGQLLGAGKGMSFKNKDETLDMRLSEHDGEDATAFLKRATSSELYEVFARFGEEPLSQKIADGIVIARSRRPIETVGQLVEVIDRATGQSDTRIYSRIFQAIRMLVNDEIENLKKGFEGALKVVKSGGVIVVITFNSGEDRVVKRLIAKNTASIEKSWKVKKRRPKQFERSALMRVVIKK